MCQGQSHILTALPNLSSVGTGNLSKGIQARNLAYTTGFDPKSGSKAYAPFRTPLRGSSKGQCEGSHAWVLPIAVKETKGSEKLFGAGTRWA